jgi:hypothetical protein
MIISWHRLDDAEAHQLRSNEIAIQEAEKRIVADFQTNGVSYTSNGGLQISFWVRNEGRRTFTLESYRWRKTWTDMLAADLERAGLAGPHSYRQPSDESKPFAAELVRPLKRYDGTFFIDNDEGVAHVEAAGIPVETFEMCWLKHDIEITVRGELGNETVVAISVDPPPTMGPPNIRLKSSTASSART